MPADEVPRTDPSPLLLLPEVLFELAGNLALRGPTEAGLDELPPSELEVLRLITIFPGCGISFLSERTSMRQANTSSTVRSLVARGLVTKEKHEVDRRAVRLVATPQAAGCLQLLRQVWLRRLLHALDKAGVSEERRLELMDTLSAVRHSLSGSRTGFR